MEEIKKILEMVNQGKVSADEGTRLIQALGATGQIYSGTASAGKPKFVRSENSSDNDVVNEHPVVLGESLMRFIPNRRERAGSKVHRHRGSHRSDHAGS